jgi:DNA-binding transcriptional regulator/RsmH inhibitor MraZ
MAHPSSGGNDGHHGIFEPLVHQRIEEIFISESLLEEASMNPRIVVIGELKEIALMERITWSWKKPEDRSSETADARKR